MAKNIVTLNIDNTDYSFRPYGTCSTSSYTATKVVSCPGFTLTTGATILVKFTYSNSTNSPKLNVNSTGAITIKFCGNDLTSTGSENWKAGDIIEFFYDGTYWVLLKTDTNDVNTTGSTNDGLSKLYLIGSTDQAESSITYSNSKCYINNSNLYSNDKKVATISDIPSIVNGLNSTSTGAALSANQGKVLNEKFNDYYTKDEVDDLLSENSGGSDITVINNLTSISTTNALSANQGRILNSNKADKATTLSGYGITNAYTKTEVDSSFVKNTNGEVSESLSVYGNLYIGENNYVTNATITSTGEADFKQVTIDGEVAATETFVRDLISISITSLLNTPT